MSYPIEQEQKLYTYKDYLKLPDDQRYEIIDGILYMAPSPSTQHQRVSRKLLVLIDNHLKGKECEVFNSPYDVLLTNNNEDKENDIKIVVQPDIFVVCDESKITKNNCVGSPDFIIEIVSPSMPSRDYVKKLYLYEKHKVKEYWIVNYIRNEVTVFKLNEDGDYDVPEIYKDDVNVKVGIFEDLIIDLKEIFE